jgi:GH15 family glucan-1,4-alpha-glucosidase
MSRPVMLSNGQMMVGLDELGLVGDFYYPYVGLDNLTNARSMHHKIGVWANGKFSWVDEKGWDIKVDFDNEALISIVSMLSADLGVLLEFNDFVDNNNNAFIRRISVTNTSDSPSDIRLFMHQVFQISRAGRADTALFVPDANYILDYKGGCALLIYAQTSDYQLFDQYAVGSYNIEGKRGTYIDAEDGELSGNAVEHGGVDSVIRFKMLLNPKEIKKVDYWVVAAASQYECEVIHSTYLRDGIDAQEQGVRESWHDWLNNSALALQKVDDKYVDCTRKSLMVIKAHIDKRGGILASGDSSIFNYGRDYYCYCWPRDGAYAIWPLIRLGYQEEARNFFEFCRDTIDKNGYMMHKYQPDRAIGSTWHPLVHDKRRELAIQEDETAIIIVMLGEYLDKFKETEFVEQLYASMVKPMADFMAKFIDENTNLPHASYDIWEEKFLTTTYTTVLVEYALKRAAKFAKEFNDDGDAERWDEAAKRINKAFSLLYNDNQQAFRKGFHIQPDGSLQFDDTLDASSLYGAFVFGDNQQLSDKILATARAVETRLINPQPAGGVIRHEQDWYMSNNYNQQPNPWHVCTLWLAQYYIHSMELDKARDILDWSMRHGLPSGALSEEVDPITGYALSVAPLVWSHAEFINTVLDLTAKQRIVNS